MISDDEAVEREKLGKLAAVDSKLDKLEAMVRNGKA